MASRGNKTFVTIIGCISDCMAFAPCRFAHRKRKWTECCSLRDIFSSNGAAFNIYKWRHSDMVYIKSSVCSWLNSIPSMYFRFFTFWKLTEWRHFVTYLWNDWAFASTLVKLHLFANVVPDGFLCSSYLIFDRNRGAWEPLQGLLPLKSS